MGKIYVHQTALSVKLTVGVDITGATPVVKYRKPSGATGEWSATIVDAANGVIKYDISSPDDIDETGTWTFWAEVTFATGEWAPGEATEKYVYNPGE